MLGSCPYVGKKALALALIIFERKMESGEVLFQHLQLINLDFLKIIHYKYFDITLRVSPNDLVNHLHL